MKIPFDIKYRQQIESGEYKVETRDGRVVHNIWWVKKPSYTNNRKMEVCALIDGEEDALVFFEGGRYLPTTKDTDSPFDLFIVTPEEELTEFEKELESFYNHHLQVCSYDNQGPVEDSLLDGASKLLALARKEFIKQGYVIEKKAFHDAVEKVAPEVMKEVSDKVDMEEALRLGYEKGKAEALKDFPRWEKDESFETEGTFMGVKGRECFVVKDGYSISVAELIKKLPGFKED